MRLPYHPLDLPILEFMQLINSSIFITSSSSSSSFFGTIKKKRGTEKRKCGSYMIRIILCIDRKIYAVLHHCNFAICKYDSSLSLKLWGYGRFAWTAGAFGSLTNGQALPPTLYDIDPLKLSNVRDPLNSF